MGWSHVITNLCCIISRSGSVIYCIDISEMRVKSIIIYSILVIYIYIPAVWETSTVPVLIIPNMSYVSLLWFLKTKTKNSHIVEIPWVFWFMSGFPIRRITSSRLSPSYHLLLFVASRHYPKGEDRITSVRPLERKKPLEPISLKLCEVLAILSFWRKNIMLFLDFISSRFCLFQPCNL